MRCLLLLVHLSFWICKVKSRALHYGIKHPVECVLFLHFDKCNRFSMFVHTYVCMSRDLYVPDIKNNKNFFVNLKKN